MIRNKTTKNLAEELAMKMPIKIAKSVLNPDLAY